MYIYMYIYIYICTYAYKPFESFTRKKSVEASGRRPSLELPKPLQSAWTERVRRGFEPFEGAFLD